MASESLIKQIPRLLGPGLNKAGKFPTLLTHNESMMAKLDEVKATIKFQMKKVCWVYVMPFHLASTNWSVKTLGITTYALILSVEQCLQKGWIEMEMNSQSLLVIEVANLRHEYVCVKLAKLKDCTVHSVMATFGLYMLIMNCCWTSMNKFGSPVFRAYRGPFVGAFVVIHCVVIWGCKGLP